MYIYNHEAMFMFTILIRVSCTLFHAAMSLDYGSEINLSSKNELSTTFCQHGYIRPLFYDTLHGVSY